MRISDALVEKLVHVHGISDAQLNALHAQANTEKKPLQDLVLKANLISEKDLTRLYAKEIDVPYAELSARDIKRDVLRLIPERIARQYKAVVFDVAEDGSKLLAMEDPDDIQAINFLQKQLGTDLKVHLATESTIQTALDQYRGNISSELTKVISPDATAEDEEEEVSEEDLAEDSPIAQTVNLIIEYAVKANASDIHIEPRETYVLVRYRVDGILREANKLPKKVLSALTSRIKILSNLKIDERRAPQDGRFKAEVSNQLFAIRVSTLPIVDGEKVVMRILNESAKAASLQELGFWGISLQNINHAITQPHGLILVTGPTGSGKSTTLFSVLSMLNNPAVNISTVEDPVEYRIPGTNQTQVNPVAGMTFVNGLRALLRQDPNIIMVGEIRDSETANLGVQAALTGHLVFSTLHTNNAATSLPRLLDMGIEPFLIASTVRAVVGQRLVRKLCVDCRESYVPDQAVMSELTESFGIDDQAVMKQLHGLEGQALAAGIGQINVSKINTSSPAELSTTDTQITRLWKAHEQGCEHCGHSGYKGRLGIYEVLDSSSGIQKLIVTSATSDGLQNEAIKAGMITMQIDGLVKALRGQTSVEEILRVTSEK
ncbi:MAG TPA: GspE/PulE family protein [Patescibacteria group bacterium]|nr:GspE/PulE family protein [Patescibacteria group bacterium]